MRDAPLAFFSWSVALFVLGIFALLVYEGWAFWNGYPPITDRVRMVLKGAPAIALISAFVLGALVSHFYWSGTR